MPYEKKKKGRAGGGGRKCGKQRTCGSPFLDVWQIKELAGDFLDLWQTQELQEKWREKATRLRTDDDKEILAELGGGRS